MVCSFRSILAISIVLGCVEKQPAAPIISPTPNVTPSEIAAPPNVEAEQTLDDLFEAVARQVPEFGGMFLSSDQQTLQVYLTNITPDKEAAVQRERAIVAVFGASVIPEGGIRPLQGQYRFLQLREWYSQMVGPILSTPGVTATDISEAVNRLGIGIEKKENEPQIVEVLKRLNIPREAVAIEVTGPIQLLHPGIDTGQLLHTVRDRFSPRQGGYIIRRLFCNQVGIGIAGSGTLGFNAKSLSTSGNVRGFVTNSHNTAAWWNLDTNLVFPPAGIIQASGYYPSELVGQETIDPQGFRGFPCPTGKICRYSDSAFITYNTGVASTPGTIARTINITTSILSPILTVDYVDPEMFGISAPPSMPYLVGLQLNKVGSTTGWTQGTIQMTDAIFPVPSDNLLLINCPNNNTDPTLAPPDAILLSQYVVWNPVNDVVNGGDSGSPVFRISNAQTKQVELYGILWGSYSGSHKYFIFSPIGGSPYQPAGIQTDIGPLDYVTPVTSVTSP